MRRLLLLLALILLSAPLARAAQPIFGNTPTYGARWAYCDSVIRHVGTLGVRPFYLVEGVTTRGQADSVWAAWRAGTSTPTFRRISGIMFFNEATSFNPATLTFFHPNGTSANNHFMLPAQVMIFLPVEADSVHLSSQGTAVSVCTCVW